MKPPTKRESLIQQEIMLEVSKSPWNLIVRRNVGLFKTLNGNPIRIGQVGEADVQGILGNQKCPSCGAKIHPKPFAIEVKDETNTQSDEQIRWMDNVWKRRGALFVLARSVPDAVKGLDLK